MIEFLSVKLPANLAGIKPGDLGPCQMRPVWFPGVGNRDLHNLAADAFDCMAMICKAETGYALTTTGAYRSRQQCLDVFNQRYTLTYLPIRNVLTNRRTGPDGKRYYLRKGMMPVAGFTNGVPDSNHAKGLAFDNAIWMKVGTTWSVVHVQDKRATYVDKKTGKTRTVWDWLVDNAVSFGWSWEGAKPGKPGWEAHHLRYVAGDATPQRILDIRAWLAAA